jgi:hypothetical protein
VYGNVKNQNLSAELIDDLETANLPARKYLKVISGRNLGGLGYQFRTEAQYKLEEQVRAKLTKQWYEQHKTSRRPDPHKTHSYYTHNNGYQPQR